MRGGGGKGIAEGVGGGQITKSSSNSDDTFGLTGSGSEMEFGSLVLSLFASILTERSILFLRCFQRSFARTLSLGISGV